MFLPSLSCCWTLIQIWLMRLNDAMSYCKVIVLFFHIALSFLCWWVFFKISCSCSSKRVRSVPTCLTRSWISKISWSWSWFVCAIITYFSCRSSFNWLKQLALVIRIFNILCWLARSQVKCPTSSVPSWTLPWSFVWTLINKWHLKWWWRTCFILIFFCIFVY